MERVLNQGQWGGQDDAQEVRIGNTEAEASPMTGRCPGNMELQELPHSHLNDSSSWGNGDL